RLDQAKSGLNSGVLEALKKRFQVRLYRFGKDLERVEKLDQLSAASNASRLGDGITQALADASTLPLGALVVLSDGADNAGGIDLETIAQIRQRRIPVHTVGYGREKLAKDIEISDVVLPARTLSDSRLNAEVTFRQFGFSQQKAKVVVRDSGKVVASKDVVLKGEGLHQSEALQFNAGLAGAKSYQVSVEPLQGEENKANNALTRLVNVESVKPRILYIEGEPRWEFKFIRRAVEEDRSLQLVTMLRTTQNKIYRQGPLLSPKELEDGFPMKAEELFAYSGLVIGSVEASYFTPAQQELIKEFANRRGGGVLFLGGRASLSDGGYPRSPLAEMLPVTLLDRKDTFHRDPANFELTTPGRDSVICRLEEKPERNLERWKKMPLIADYQEVGEAKPGAAVLAEVNAPGKRKTPLLVTETYGRGRTALFATSGSWRWQMLQDRLDMTHEAFWNQLLRWLVADTAGRVTSSTPRPVLSDETKVKFRAEVRDKAYKSMSNARVEVKIVGPEGVTGELELNPQALEEGIYTGEWTADKPGSYVAEVLVKQDKEEVGRDVVMFRREDGVAENFRVAQNRELLEKLAEQTGGRYYAAKDIGKLAGQISYSEAGISTRETKDLWDMPVIFLAALLIRGSEWLLRRKWGVV
ncbi:MAG: glutamine amidotransferase, partial [Bryobacteraceae bacterium]